MTYLSNSITQKDEKVKKIVEKVCVWHGLFPHNLFKRGRKRPIVEARQEAWYFVRRNVIAKNGSKMSLSDIGKISHLWGFDTQMDADNKITDTYQPTVHYHQMLGHLNYNLCMRNDSEEVDFLIKTLNEKRESETPDQDSQENLEMEVVQGAIN